jgi:hypothetical protein
MRTLLPIALVVVAVLAGSAAGAATVLSSAPLGSGKATVSRCDSDGFKYTNTLDTSGNVTAVTVAGINLACAGGALSLTLASSGGTSLGAGSASLPSSGFSGSATVAVSPQPAVGSIAVYHAAIAGP